MPETAWWNHLGRGLSGREPCCHSVYPSRSTLHPARRPTSRDSLNLWFPVGFIHWQERGGWLSLILTVPWGSLNPVTPLQTVLY